MDSFFFFAKKEEEQTALPLYGFSIKWLPKARTKVLLNIKSIKRMKLSPFSFLLQRHLYFYNGDSRGVYYRGRRPRYLHQ